jgi:hypothetical protein
MTRYIKDGKIKNRNQIIIKKDKKQIINPKHEDLIADGWVEYVIPTYERTIEDYRRDKIYEINNYDSSTNINEFFLGGTSIWLDKATRAGLKLRFEAEQQANITETALWYNGIQFPISVDLGIQILLAVELYASACYDNTQKHMAAVNALTSVEEIEAYDYTTGYPEKLNF